MKKIASILIILTLCAVASPLLASGNESGWEKGKHGKWTETKTKELTEQTKKEVKTLDVQSLHNIIETHEDYTLLDVRTKQEFDAAHIEDAVYLPRGLVEFAIWSIVEDLDKPIYVYCKTGPRAWFVTKRLNELGYKNAVAVDTGIIEWVQSGYPVKTSIVEQLVVLTPAL